MTSVTLTITIDVSQVEAVGRAVSEVISEKDGSAIAAVKGKTRLANATSVDALPSSPSPDLSLVQATADRDAGHMPTCALTPRDDLTIGTHSPEREPGNPEVCAISSKRSSSGDSRPAARGSLENAAPSPAGDPIRTRPSFRPHCQNRDLCRSGTRDHCHSCRKALVESEAA